uniref:Cilia- and flagella-associated protein 65 n=1 Tax=Geotrypetes seraphini TaxID=260995 RepID=A0A6P8QYY4_GEOSA|nr:cilia- and flagella-associated protein 65 [Geotrypetes seraphini]XP_033800999.1 cilia- and flagella-associated protein 65 [Geotrypetes seraphini]XP_033801000.1 cilia- and flagella-associated protein 65 [Geotrypetes seraphini]
MLTQVPSFPLRSSTFQNFSESWQKMKHEVTSLESSVKKKTKKGTFLGVEVVESLEWHGWELGKEITKMLTLKNVHLRIKKLKFSPPTSIFFTTMPPQMIMLSPGTSFSIPITFRPMEKREYEDHINFHMMEGMFTIALYATLLRCKLQIPESLNLPICAVGDSSEAFFTIHNTGELQTDFKLEAPEYFILLPASGRLEPKEKCKIKVVFKPQKAMPHEVKAVCQYGVQWNKQKSIYLLSLAKYSHLLVKGSKDASFTAGLQHSELHFGPVAVGTTAKKYMEIINMSPVNAQFCIERIKPPSELEDYVFFCEVVQGVVPAYRKLQIPVKYTPQTVGVASIDFFTVIPLGSISKSVLKVTGLCQGPCVSLQYPLLYFGLINLGEQKIHTVEISNTSNASAYYQFLIDCKESTFCVDCPCGILKGNSTQILKVTFNPKHPISYYRRVICLIHHQDSLFLDLIGTCYSTKAKPAIVHPKHISLYRTHMVRGLSLYPTDILCTMLQEGKLQMDANGAFKLLEEEHEDRFLEVQPYINPGSEFFEISSEITMFSPHISISTRDFDFGCCVDAQCTELLPLTLTNHTKGKVSVTWIFDPAGPFRVIPESSDIPPLKSMAFRLSFWPVQLNTMYAAELEAYVCYKVQRDYRSVEDFAICPPWCLTISARGHTFQAGHEHSIPNYILDSQKVVFPAVIENSVCQRSLLLQNTGTLLMVFSLNYVSCPSIMVKPTSGYILPGAHQIILLRTSPKETTIERRVLYLQFNSCERYTQVILLLSRVEEPQLFLGNERRLLFKPTCVGNVTERSYTVKNCSRVPLHFEWKIQHCDREVLSVNPATGIIQPSDTVAQTWSFVPREQIKYMLKPSVLVWGVQEHQDLVSRKRKHYTIRVIGEGCSGTISAEQDYLHLGNILVGTLQTCNLVLINSGNCSLDYELGVEQSITGLQDPDEEICDPLALELENSKGTIPARTKCFLKVTVRPIRRFFYTWSISYVMLTPKAVDLTKIPVKTLLCRVVAQGVFPMLSITDACSAGSAKGIGKGHLWRLMSLDSLNLYFERDPTPAEMIYRVPTRHSIRRCPSVYTSAILDFNFGAAPVESESSIVSLMLENRGVVPATWNFLFPVDQQIELEYWAESGEFDSSEYQQLRIEDSKLFTVSPKSGNLNPGQHQILQLTYRHDVIGTDRLPVLLKVSHGREILLNFIGGTVAKDRHYIHFTSNKHQFTPVIIGCNSPPKQIYELYNGGAVSVVYEVQLNPLRDIQEQNFQHSVFQCLNPRGLILPGTSAHVEWIFAPLEAKTYSVDIPIHIIGGDSTLITFEGIGYDKHVLGETATFDDFVSEGLSRGAQKLSVPGQAAVLSKQKINFGNIPVLSRSSRLIFLNNTSEHDAIYFSWLSSSPNICEILDASPQSGIIQPGESTPCVVTLITSEDAMFYSLDLICEIFMQEALAHYEQELQAWEKEKECQEVEFTITEENLNADEIPNEVVRDHFDLARSGKSNEVPEIRKYKTLPPIKTVRVSRPPASRNQLLRKANKESSKMWIRPRPPNPFPLHLGVTARSHPTDDFLNNFQTDFPRHFIYQKRKKKPILEDETTVPPPYLPWMPTAQETQLLTDIMSTIIRSLLNDVQFHSTMIQSLSEPLPYFSQFWSNKPSKVPTSSLTASLKGSVSFLPTNQEEEEEGKREKQKKKEEEEDTGREIEEDDEEEEVGGEDEGEVEEKQEGELEDIEEEDVEKEEEHEKQFQEEEAEEKPEEVGEKEGEGEEVDKGESKASEVPERMEETTTVGIEQAAEENLQAILSQVKDWELKENIKRTSVFSDLMESVLQTTLKNILTEAFRGEVVLTARPRVIALPPAKLRSSSSGTTDRSGSSSQNAHLAKVTSHRESLKGQRTSTPL